jgi:hypothetical protein
MPKTLLRLQNLLFQQRPSYPHSPGASAQGWIFTAGQLGNGKGKLVGIGDVHADPASAKQHRVQSQR